MSIEDIDELICKRIEFATQKKKEGPGTTGTDPVYWEGLWEGQIRVLQTLREEIKQETSFLPE